jgi:hypothetical protein
MDYSRELESSKSGPPSRCPYCSGNHWKRNCPLKRVIDEAARKAREEENKKKENGRDTVVVIIKGDKK